MGEEGRHSLFTMFAFGSNCHAFWSSASQEVAEHCLLMHFAHIHANFCFWFSKLPYLNLWIVFHLIFSGHPAGTESSRAAWWALESPARVNPPHAQGNKNFEFNADAYASLLFKIYSKTFSKATWNRFPIIPLWYSVSSPIRINSIRKPKALVKDTANMPTANSWNFLKTCWSNQS